MYLELEVQITKTSNELCAKRSSRAGMEGRNKEHIEGQGHRRRGSERTNEVEVEMWGRL